MKIIKDRFFILVFALALSNCISCNYKPSLKNLLINENKCWTLAFEKRDVVIGSDTIKINKKGILGKWCFNKKGEFLEYNKNKNLVEFPIDLVVERKWEIINDSVINIYGKKHIIIYRSDSTLKLSREFDSAFYLLIR